MSENRELAVLETALELIHDPECWIKGDEAQSADGLPVTPTSPHAVKFCIIGAINAAYRMRGYRTPNVRLHCFERLTSVLGDIAWDEIEEFNDDEETTHEDVILAFKRAISEWIEA